MSSNQYLNKLEKNVQNAYEIAKMARSKGLDPSRKVEIFLAKDVSGRVEGLVGMLVPKLIDSGLKERIKALEVEMGKGSEEIGFTIAKEVAQGKFCKFENDEKAIEAGMRVGTAYWTLGIVTAPLEGLIYVKLKKRRDGEKYLSLYFAGPIRSAGGTTNAMIILLGDYLRKLFDLKRYDPSNDETERYNLELEDYHKRITRLQYFPSKEEVVEIVGHLPVEVTGEATEKLEVLAFKDLDRVETNAIRGGMVLTLSMLALKAPKILKRLKKWGKTYELEDWKWLEKLSEYKKKQNKSSDGKTTAIYLAEIPGGRPVFGHPDRIGGFRLRYGRARNTGFAAVGLNPSTVIISDSFLAMGAQLKVGLPGKSAAVAPVDSIDGPIVRLKNGNVVKIRDIEHAKVLTNQVEKILYLGDILISYGEFLTNGKKLVPSAWVPEWWIKEIQAHDKHWTQKEVSFEKAVELSKKFGVPLHPDYSFYWESLSVEDVRKLKKVIEFEEVDWSPVKEVLEKLGVEHQIEDEKVIVNEVDCKLIKFVLGGSDPGGKFESGFELVNKLSPIKIRKKAGHWLGARMGRPEKAERRTMRGSPHALFPAGRTSRLRNIIDGLDGKTAADLSLRVCPKCQRRTYYLECPRCKVEAIQKYKCIKCGATGSFKTHCNLSTRAYEAIFMKENLEKICRDMEVAFPTVLKGVKGMSSDVKIPEHLEKGVLRSKYELNVNKDGTVRVDSTDMPLTHFKARELDVSIEKLRELGYETDKDGYLLENEEQLIEIKPQDIVVSDDVTFSSANYLVKVTKFIDELLVKFYGGEPYYNVEKKDDLIGKLVIGLAPHTSAGIIGRIIGFSPVRSGLAHPAWHAAKKRNCDGDEDSIILLMDGLLNFSREFLPSSRGGKTMDVPLVLTTRLNLLEVDDEAHDMDVVDSYPLEFYNATLERKYPWDIPLTTLGKLDVESIDKMGFTHSTSNIAAGPMMTAYKTLGSMANKVKKQLELAIKIQAVDENDVASKILDSHFIKDIKGNLRRFHTQRFRCMGCNDKFRRPPLIGKCPKCGGKINQTVYEGTIKKYLDASIKIANDFNVSNYIKNQLAVVKKRTNMTFGGDKQEGLDTWFK